MAETINIENSKYEFDVLLISKVQGSTGEDYTYKSVPITKSSIKYLEITDDLINFGYTGTITFTNYFGILQKLGSYNVTDEAPYIYVKFSNKDFASSGVTAPPIYFFGSLGRNTETSKNVIDKHLTFEFEEYLVAKLKRVNVYNTLSNVAKSDLSFVSGVARASETIDTPATLIKNLIEKGSSLAGITTTVSISGKPIEDDVVITEAAQITDDTSVFNAVHKLANFLSFTPSSNMPAELSDFSSPGLIKIENTPDNKKRRVIIKSLADDIQPFLSLIKENKSSDKIKNYLTEKFSIALSNDPRTFGDNFISKYDLMRVNYQDVYENKWCNYDCICGTTDCTINLRNSYEVLRVAFERMFTVPYATNLPKRTEDVAKGFVKTITYSIPQVPEKLALAYGVNTLFKSFIFDNIALTFRVKGQPYRSAGKFIQIEADNSSTSGTVNKNNNSDELNGYWYIISVKHVFENDIYFNDYICVKVYSNTGSPSPIPNREAGSSAIGAGFGGGSLSNGTEVSTSSVDNNNNDDNTLKSEEEEIAELLRSGKVSVGSPPSNTIIDLPARAVGESLESYESQIGRQLTPDEVTILGF